VFGGWVRDGRLAHSLPPRTVVGQRAWRSLDVRLCGLVLANGRPRRLVVSDAEFPAFDLLRFPGSGILMQSADFSS